ncbi:hypothetical protein DXG01_014868 [Tephrocybe rancida]|nr:hypothetical protein DXG01_014868 [Tephrocybe rancida]
MDSTIAKPNDLLRARTSETFLAKPWTTNIFHSDGEDIFKTEEFEDDHVQSFLTSFMRDEEARDLAPTHRNAIFCLAIQDKPPIVWEAVSAHAAEEALLEKLMEYRLPLTRLNDWEALFREMKHNFQHFLKACDVIGNLDASSSTQKVLSVVLNIQATTFYLSFALDEKHFRLPPTHKALAAYLNASQVNKRGLRLMPSEVMPSEVRNPLLVAMLSSLICLLLPYNLKHAPGHSALDQAFESIDVIALSRTKGWFTKPLAPPVPHPGFSAYIESEDEEEDSRPGTTPSAQNHALQHCVEASRQMGYIFQTPLQSTTNPGGNRSHIEAVQQGGTNVGRDGATGVFGWSCEGDSIVPPNSGGQNNIESTSAAGGGTHIVNLEGDRPHIEKAQTGGGASGADRAATRPTGENCVDAEEGPQQSAAAGADGAATKPTGETCDDAEGPQQTAAGGDTCDPNTESNAPRSEPSQHGAADLGGGGGGTLHHKTTDNGPQQIPAASANVAGVGTDTPSAAGNGPHTSLSQYGATGGGDLDAPQANNETLPRDTGETLTSAQGGETTTPNAQGQVPRLILPQYNPGLQPAGGNASDSIDKTVLNKGGEQQGGTATSTDMSVDGGASGGQSRDNAMEEQPQGKGGISMDVSVDKRASGGQSGDNEGEEQPQGAGQAGPSSRGKDKKKPEPEPETKPKPKHKPKQKTGYEQDGVRFEKVSSKLFKQVVVIDLEAECDQNDSHCLPLSSYTGRKSTNKKTYEVHNSTGLTNPPYTPQFHRKYEVTYVERLLDLSTDARFGSRRLSWMTARGIAAPFTTKNIVITRARDLEQPFDKTRLAMVGPLDRTIVVLDFSVAMGTDMRRQSTLDALYHVVKTSGKGITTEDLPLSVDSFGRDVFLSNIFVWSHVVGEEYFTHLDSIPTMELRWGTVLTGDTSQDFRIAPNGFATVIKVVSGRKLLVMAEPRIRQGVFDHLANINIYTGNIDEKVMNRRLFSLQSLILETDDTL